MNLCALITTCQRPDGLRDTLDAIGEMPAIIVQDGGELYVPIYEYRGTHIHMPRAGGKRGYWKRINTLWEAAKVSPFDHFIHLTDDIEYDPDWLERVIEQYDRTRPLNICVNGRPSNWGLTNYVDGGFIAPRQCFEALAWKVEKIDASRWVSTPQAGSGVWPQVTRRWRRRGIIPKMITADPIRSSFDPSKSLMNPGRYVPC